MRGLYRDLSLRTRQLAAVAADRAAGLRRKRTVAAAPPDEAPSRELPSPDGQAATEATVTAGAAEVAATTEAAEAGATATTGAAGATATTGTTEAAGATAIVGALRGLLLRAWHRAVAVAGSLRGLPLRAWQRTAVAGGLATLLLLGGALAAGAWASGPSDRILAGVTVDGLDVGRMTQDEATRAVEANLRPSLNRQIVITVGAKRFRMTPASVGRGRAVDQAVAEALAGPRLSALGAFWHKVVKRPVAMDVHVAGTRQDERVAAFVAQIAKKVAVAPIDAVFALRDGELVKRKARSGKALDQAAATKALIKVLNESGRTSAKLPLYAVAPKIADKDLGQTIEIDKSVNRLWLYQGMKVVKSYRVATAMSGFVTPSGSWKVAYKEVNPTWNNPAPDTWGKDMPLTIPPGPGNPLGTRALGLDAPAILIHGSYATGSIGGYASHGCIRMTIWDAEDIFPRVKVGTRVLIHR